MKSRKGFTLTEILICVVILTILGSLLVMMLSQSVKMWDTVEENKNLQSRAQFVFDKIRKDLNNLRIIYDNEENQSKIFKNYSYFYFYCEQTDEGSQRLIFTRSQNNELLTTKIKSALAVDIGATQQSYVCVAYFVNPFVERGQLLRGVFPFGMRPKEIINRNSIKREDYLKSNFQPVGEGVIFIGFDFKTSHGKPLKTSDIKKSYAHYPTWDSTRIMDKNFKFYKGQRNNEPIEPILPDDVEVVIALSQSNSAETTLKESCDKLSQTIYIYDTDKITNLTKYLKIENEIVEMKNKRGSKIELERRGAFNTRPSPHKNGTPVYAIFVFKKTFPLHLYRGTVEEN